LSLRRNIRDWLHVPEFTVLQWQSGRWRERGRDAS